MNQNTSSKVQKITRTGLIAALYTALSLALGPLSVGIVQLRASEALTLLPVLCPEAVWGVTLGCLITNMLLSTPVDMVVGTTLTLLAALATRALGKYRIKGIPVLAALPPIVFNALGIGAQLTILAFYPATAPIGVFLANMGSVGLGQVVSCGVLGLALIFVIEKNKFLTGLFAGKQTN